MAKTKTTTSDIAQFTGHPEFPNNLAKGQGLRLGDITGLFTGIEGGRFVVLATDQGVRKFLSTKLQELYPPAQDAPATDTSPASGRIVAVTGHVDIEAVFRRAPPLEGAAYDPEIRVRVGEELSCYLETILCVRRGVAPAELTIVSGMARGVDEIAAFYAMDRGLPLICVVPNSVRWHQSRPAVKGVRAQAIEYQRILAYERVRVMEVNKDYPGGPYPYSNFARNQALVDVADEVVSWKRRDSAGTEDCVKRARDAGKYFGNVKSLGPRADRLE
ncbi:MAG: hypothetical protein P1P84_08750 [Deferrisomatales bacterium]|nr:hypothetical protein [Deferrisomatales bacterium]